MSGLSNHFLENFLLPKCENFIGVYPVDRVPLNLWGRCCSAIINLSEADHPGSHFIAIYIDRDNVLWYFDSFALLPPIYNSHLFDFLKKWIRCGKMKCVLSLAQSKILIRYFVAGTLQHSAYLSIFTLIVTLPFFTPCLMGTP